MEMLCKSRARRLRLKIRHAHRPGPRFGIPSLLPDGKLPPLPQPGPSPAVSLIMWRSCRFCSCNNRLLLVQRWHLRLADDQAKHALFSCSKGFREQKIYLDDDLTKLQLEGRHSLAARKASLKGQGHRNMVAS